MFLLIDSKTSISFFSNLGNNRIKVLPPEVGLLTSLQELNISSNLLTYLPAELFLIRNLVILAGANPYLPPPIIQTTGIRTSEDKNLMITHSSHFSIHFMNSLNNFLFNFRSYPHRIISQIFPSLSELCSRLLLPQSPTSISSDMLCILPHHLHDPFREAMIRRDVSHCTYCNRIFIQDGNQIMIWHDVASLSRIPVLYRFCSPKCIFKTLSS